MGKLVAKVSVSKAIYVIDKPYDYLVPEELESALLAGMRVIVPFGRSSHCCEGIVLALDQTDDWSKLKTITALLDEKPILDQKGIQLALWMRERCFCTVYDAVRAMLPTGLFFSLKDCLTLTEGLDQETAYTLAAGQPGAVRLLDFLYAWGGKGDMEQIRAAFGKKNPATAIRTLIQQRIAAWGAEVERNLQEKREKIAILALPVEEAQELLVKLKAKAPTRYAVLELLSRLGAVSLKDLRYYTGAGASTLRAMEKAGYLRLEQRELLADFALESEQTLPPPELNAEQQRAFLGLEALCGKEAPAAALLYGVTGSGKTQVYLRLIYTQLERGRTALVLVPEIALTPQLLRIFTAHFGARVAVLHSSLRTSERYQEWKRIRSGQAQVVIGTRSAVFAPLEHLGLVVLDEEQEGSYKSENSPRYHAREIAKYRCVQNGALLLLGSATPSVETMYFARQGVYHLFTLSERYNQRALPEVIMADMKEELRQGNGTGISGILREELKKNLSRGEQSILFLNRRGASNLVTCVDCGQVPDCPNCSAHLVYHSANHRLMCHYCGYSVPMISHCPHCGGEYLFLGYGTQKLQSELEALFPGTEILRMDTDTVSASNSHEKILSRFQKERIPILLGTQMVAKGLDFENVTLVGVVAADLSLYINDYRAGERCFSLITQVVGRAGRGTKAGRAVIQSFTPENDVIRFASHQDYDSFFEQELALRANRGFPPYRDMLVITASGTQEEGVLRACSRLRQMLAQALTHYQLPVQLLGPAPASVVKVNNRYRYRLIAMGKNTGTLRRIVSQLLCHEYKAKENKGITLVADFSPFDQ